MEPTKLDEPFIGFFKEWVSKDLNQDSSGITNDTPILKQGLLDSLQIMQLISAIEERYTLSIPLEEVIEENFVSPKTIGDLLAAIMENS